MMFFSHIAIGKFLYQEYATSESSQILMDKKAFIYGNIMPDVTKLVFLKHQVSDTYDLYQEYLAKAKDNHLDSKERSEALGIAIHFICDYFCKYHSRSPYAERNLFFHFWYELWLHFHVKFFIAWKKGMKVLKGIIGRKEPNRGMELKLDLFQFLDQYDKDDKTAMIDVKYAFRTLQLLMIEVTGVRGTEFEERIRIDILGFEGYAKDGKVSC